MALPPNAVLFARVMDPEDIEVFVIELSQGEDPDDFLAPGEGVSSYTLTLTPEAVAAGLEIKTGGGYATTLVGLTIQFWLQVDPGEVDDPRFDGSGVSLGIELTVTTTSSPARRKQRTVAVNVANQ